MIVRMILTAMLAFPFACAKKDSASKDSSSQQQDAGDDKLSDPTPVGPQAGNLAIVEVAVSAVAAQGAFLTTQSQANTSNNATPGNLALAIAFDFTSEPNNDEQEKKALHLSAESDKYRTPSLPGFSIVSGAPDEMILFVRKVALERRNGDEEVKKDDTPPPGPYSIKDSHITLFPAGAQDPVRTILGQSFATLDELLAALSTKGIDQNAAHDIFSSRMNELPISWTPSAVVQDDSKGPSVAIIFEDEVGKPIKIANGTVDLSALAASSEGGVVSFEIPEGEYNTLSITYATKAQVKGCVKMLYECRRTPEETPCDNDLPTADVPGNKNVAPNTSLPGSPRAELLTYCTQDNKSLYSDLKTQNSDFIDKAPQLMDFPLGMDDQNEWKQAASQVNASYRLPEPVKVKSGEETPRITLLVDLNRMLRYYNRGRQDQGPNPSMPKDRSYFFTSIFIESTYAFLGSPGRIYGFEMQANACKVESNDTSETLQGPYNPATGKCQNAETPAGKVPFWMTIITAGNGAPLYAITSPDDDNDLTITKGNVSAWQHCPGDGPVKKWVEAESNTSPQKVSIRYGLCDSKKGMGSNGIYKHFPASLESIPVLATQEALGDGNVVGVVIETKALNPDNGKETIYKGPVTVGRRL